MANKNKRTKARREKEVKEAQRKKVVEKPIYKRPWIWIALAALVIGIVVPSAWQYNEDLKKERAEAAAEAQAKQEAEELIWESAQEPLSKIGVTESDVSSKTFEIRSTTDGGALDVAQATIVTDVRTLLASFIYDSTENSWMCTQITNDDGSHIYWTYYDQGVENVTQTAVVGEDGTVSMQPLYDYVTDEIVPGASTGAAVEGADAAPATDDAAPADTDDAAAPATDDASAPATGAAAE
jgi:hypothetical protein